MSNFTIGVVNWVRDSNDTASSNGFNSLKVEFNLIRLLILIKST